MHLSLPLFGLLLAPRLAYAGEISPMTEGTGLVVAGIAVAIATAAVAVAWHARRCAVAAAEEAGQARVRAAQNNLGSVAPEALAAAERLWSTRFAALESQVLAPSARSTQRAGSSAVAAGSSDLAGRVEELERSMNGVAVTLKELRRVVPNRERAADPLLAVDSTQWPSFLTSEDSGIRDVRRSLAPAVTLRDPVACDLMDRLRHVERWQEAQPSSAELAVELREISALLLSVLRREGGHGPIEAAMFAERLLAALRPLWKSFQPLLDCRTLLPGATLDPDWMEDRTPPGLRRPVISEMLSWAVFEKLDAGRRVLAKARVTTE